MNPEIAQNLVGERIKDIQAWATRQRHLRVAARSRRSTASVDKEVISLVSPARADRIQRRQLEKSVSWTVPERLRFLWYRFCLTSNGMQYMSGWIVALPPPPNQGWHECHHEDPWSAL